MRFLILSLLLIGCPLHNPPPIDPTPPPYPEAIKDAGGPNG